MNLPLFFFLGLNVGRKTSEVVGGGSVTFPPVCRIRVCVARLKISVGRAMEATSFSALGV